MKLLIFCFALFSTAFAETIVFNNQTSYPNTKAKMAIQWAASAKEVNEENQALLYGHTMNTGTLQTISQRGKTTLNVPPKAQQFRVLVWSQGADAPDYATNWISLTPNKNYTLENEYLVPVVLMAGTGC